MGNYTSLLSNNYHRSRPSGHARVNPQTPTTTTSTASNHHHREHSNPTQNDNNNIPNTEVYGSEGTNNNTSTNNVPGNTFPSSATTTTSHSYNLRNTPTRLQRRRHSLTPSQSPPRNEEDIGAGERPRQRRRLYERHRSNQRQHSLPFTFSQSPPLESTNSSHQPPTRNRSSNSPSANDAAPQQNNDSHDNNASTPNQFYFYFSLDGSTFQTSFNTPPPIQIPPRHRQMVLVRLRPSQGTSHQVFEWTIYFIIPRTQSNLHGGGDGGEGGAGGGAINFDSQSAIERALLMVRAVLQGDNFEYEDWLRLSEMMGYSPTTTKPTTTQTLIDLHLPKQKHKQVGTPITCQICLDVIGKGDECRLLHCSHQFHCDCIDYWLCNGANTCPLCRHIAVKEHHQQQGRENDKDTNSNNGSNIAVNDIL